MMSNAPRATSTSERGFVLVAVLWIIAALSALATIFALYLSNSAQALAISDTSLQTEALVSASVELTAYQLSLTQDNARPLQGSFRYRMNDADIVVAFVSEGGRIHLNLAPKGLLENFLSGLGATPQDAVQYAGRIIGWRTPPKPNSVEDEAALYRATVCPCQRACSGCRAAAC